MELIRTFPSIQIKLDDDVIMELMSDDADTYVSFFAAGDTPGLAEPLNEYVLNTMYQIEGE